MLIHDVEQGTPEWHKLRRGIPTASEFSSIITPGGKPSTSAGKYRAALIDELVRPFEERPEEEQAAVFSGNYHTDRGHELEPKARAWLRLVTGFDVREVGFVTSDDGAMGCSPDALIYEGDTPVAGAEIKSPEGKKHAFHLIERVLPPEYALQVHGSMIVTGLKVWHFVSHCPGYKPFHFVQKWDEFTDKCVPILAAFTKQLKVESELFADYLPAAQNHLDNRNSEP